MSRHMCKLHTDRGEYFVGFCTTISMFVSPAMPTQEAVVRHLECVHRMSIEEGIINEREHTFDIRRHAFCDFTVLVSQLMGGRTLSDDEAYRVSHFERFLDATVAPHQYKYEKLSARVLVWMRELGFSEQGPNRYWDRRAVVSDRALFPAVHNAANVVRYPAYVRAEERQHQSKTDWQVTI